MPHLSQSLTEHLKKEHKISPFQTYLKEIVYGGNDGIVTTFAVVAGFTGAQSNSIPSYTFLTVLLFGLANLFADATSMGLGNFLSIRAEKDVYKEEEQKELHEIRNNPTQEKEETTEILREKGFTPDQAKQLTNIYATNESYWLSFMMNYELQLPNPASQNPLLTASATFFAFIVFGFIPLIPYIILKNSSETFFYSCFATIGALILLGLLRWRVTAQNPIRSILEILAVGSTAALIAYIVGTFFKL